MNISEFLRCLLAFSIVPITTNSLPISTRRSPDDCVLNKWELLNVFRGNFTNRSITDKPLYHVFNTTQNGLVLQSHISAVRCYREDDGSWRRCQDICDHDHTVGRCRDKCPVMDWCLRGKDGYQEICFRTLSHVFPQDFPPLNDVVTPNHSSPTESSVVGVDTAVRPTPGVLSSEVPPLDWYTAWPNFTISITAIACFILGLAVATSVYKIIKMCCQRKKDGISLNIVGDLEQEYESVGMSNQSRSQQNLNRAAVHLNESLNLEVAESTSKDAAHGDNGQSVNGDAAVDIASVEAAETIALLPSEKFPPIEAVSI